MNNAEKRMIMTEFISRKHGKEGYEIIIKTDSHEYYKATEDFARRLVSHSKSATNSDRIRNMTDEELAMFLCNFRSCDADEYICEGCKAEKYCRAGHVGTIDWLQQPAEEADNG